jgi:myo-inositol 2-dehydrogenase / D-chiro-inositol 1-dehydrogenase
MVFSRRRFLAQSAVAVAAVSGRSHAAESKNDRPRIGCVGVGGRGSGISRQAAQFGDIVAVCDADVNRAEAAKARFAPDADVYQDYRRLLDRNDVEVIINGTPDHWHTAINVAACRAGKDVYTEKPVTLTIDEGKVLRRVVEETGRVVQVGNQQRSAKQFQTAVELVRNGRVGPLRQVWVALPYYSAAGGPFAPEPVPTGLDWDLYQGQAPEREYTSSRTHFNFRWWYEYAGGIATDWGNHHVDIAQWGMGCDESGPKSVDARALFPNPEGPAYYNTADRFFARIEYPGGVELLFFVAPNDVLRGGPPVAQEAIDRLFGDDALQEIKTFARNGTMFIGEKGRVFVNRGGVYGKAAEELAENPLPSDAWRVQPSANHMGNFFECVKTREEPVSSVRIQHRTITVCHLTNISLRLGRPIRWDAETEQIVGDPEADGWLRREQRKPYVVEA